eukprot:3805508-Prymnesium_polylepis.2
MTGERSCDASSALVFVIGLISGTVCIIASKSLCEGTARGSDGEVEPFRASAALQPNYSSISRNYGIR